jgi:S1/P1 Nuclease
MPSLLRTIGKLTAVLLLYLCIPIPSFAWGPEGHRIVAEIARARLSPSARRLIRELIGSDDLASISTWADEIRRERPQTFGWHFVDIPWNAAAFDQSRDCFRPGDKNALQDHHNCVVDRIEMFREILADKNASAPDRVEALKFLVHFVADVHQPLHAIGEARGGNDIHVVEFGLDQCGSRPCNLHALWDEGLIEHAHRSQSGYILHLENLITRRRLEARAIGTPEDWANQSFHLAHDVWLTDGSRVDEAYYDKHISMVDERLALAGIRLARLLNNALSR